MEETYKILLGEKENKQGINADNHIGVELSANARIIPASDSQGTLDEYSQYVKENDESTLYRPIITIRPICTNVLFNAVSEIVYREGADDCKFISKNGTNLSSVDSIKKYMDYKGLSSYSLKRTDAIDDTAYSSAEIGPLVYHCGYDIFDNHRLRSEEFKVVNKLNENLDSGHKQYFNTISDYSRNDKGETISMPISRYNSATSSLYYEDTEIHLYVNDNLRGFEDSIDANLGEDKGWIGFSNPSDVEIANYVTGTTSVALNKCMNNNKACEQIDMYPDRSLYSFVPKRNKYRRRIEKNWEYCLTYPYFSIQKEGITQRTVGDRVINGIKGTIVNENFDVSDKASVAGYEGSYLTIRTDVRNTFQANETVSITIIGKKGGEYAVIDGDDTAMITSVGGVENDPSHYFLIHSEEIGDYADNFDTIEELRLRKVINNKECEYYFRVFRKIPNFKNTNVYQDDTVTEEEIIANNTEVSKFNSSMNKLAFSQTVYSDRVAQIIFNDDVNIKGLRDNLGRSLSEIYLTIVKTNYGHDKWYGGTYSDDDIEYSHCFGKISSGLDLDTNSYDYNVHRLHNVDTNVDTLLQIPSQYEALEDDITIAKGIGANAFLGDLVEFNAYRLDETVLEDVYHRFNTAQRELKNSEFEDIQYHALVSDDYDLIGKGYKTEVRNFNTKSTYDNINKTIIDTKYVGNIFPEGYYYKPHYRIPLREFNDDVYQGQHTKMSLVATYKDGTYTATAATNYYLTVGDEIRLYNKKTNAKVVGCITGVSGKRFNYITFTVHQALEDNDLSNYIPYKLNRTEPSYAYDLADGTGRYLWRGLKSVAELDSDSEIKNEVFTNGAHYVYGDFNFFLRRQDPYGYFGLSYEGNEEIPRNARSLVIGGKGTDVSQAEYETTQEVETCIR